MRRLKLVALTFAAALLPAHDASGAVVSTSGAVTGAIRALTFSGDALVVARQPTGRALRIELRRPGRTPALLLLTDADDPNAKVAVASSAQALAVGLREDDEIAGQSRVWIGPPAGPLREVASCSRSFAAPAVAVDGPRVAWSDGGCAGPTGRPFEVGPASIAFGDVDPAVAVRRTPVPKDSLPAGFSLRGDRGLAGVLRPTFFGATGDVRPFGPDGLGEALENEPGGALVPVGTLPDGTTAIARGAASSEDFGFDEERPRCRADVLLLAPGSTTRRKLQTGGCLVDSELAGQVDATVAGDRVVSRVAPLDRRREFDDFGRPRPVSITSVRADGSGLQTIVSGTYRGPRGLAADGARIGWWQRRCAGGDQLVVADGPAGALRACTAELVTRRARLRDGRISVQLRCPLGCTGRIVDDTRCGPKALRRFALAPGTRRLGLPVPRRSRSRGRVLLRVEVDGGPTRHAAVRLRR